MERPPRKEPGLADRVLEEVLRQIHSRPGFYFPGCGALGPAHIVFRTHDNNIARTLFRVCFESDGHVHDVLVKVFDDPRRTPSQRLAVAERENRSHMAALRLFADHSSFGVAPLVGPFPQQPVVVVRMLPGTALTQLLRRAVWKSRFFGPGKQFTGTLVRVGGWLRAFHDGSASGATIPLQHEALLRSVLEAFDRLSSGSLDPQLRNRLEESCRRWLTRSKVQELQVVDQHNDYLPHNILITPERIVGLDFNSATSQGCRLEDVANFLAYLELLRKLPICSRRAVREWQTSFLQGYGDSELDKPLLQVSALRCILQLLHVSIRYRQVTAPATLRFVRKMLKGNLEEEVELGGSR